MPTKPLAILLVCGIIACAPARAQLAVLDVANLKQALQQVTAWQKQYQQMAEQQAQIKQQYASTTGTRGMGNFSSDPRLQNTVPANLLDLFDALQAKGESGLSAKARALRDQAKIYDCEKQSGSDLLTCQRLLGGIAQQLALLRDALELTTTRGTQVQTLQDKINATNDPKSIAELQARMQAESLQVNNDANRLQLMRSLAEANDRAAEQAVREATLRSLSRNDNGSASFRFVVPNH